MIQITYTFGNSADEMAFGLDGAGLILIVVGITIIYLAVRAVRKRRRERRRNAVERLRLKRSAQEAVEQNKYLKDEPKY